MRILIHAYACPYPLLDTMCARQEYTLLIVGGCERKRGGGKGKKEGKEGRGNGGSGRKETVSARKYKEPDRAKNFSPFHIFHAENTTLSNKVQLSILLFDEIEF